MGCTSSKRNERPALEDFSVLADQTPFCRNEIEALHEIYKKLSTYVVKDGLIQKVFDLFYVKHNGHIDFEEFILSLSVLTRKFLMHSKLNLKDMVLALLDESDLHISEDVIETIVDKTFNEVDTKGAGLIKKSGRSTLRGIHLS